MRDQTLPIEPGARRLAALAAHAGDDAVAALRERAEDLQGLRVVHLTAPPFSSAAVDRLSATVGLLRELGLDVHWRAIAGDPGALRAGRALQDGLRGGELALEDADVDAWRAQRAAPAADVVVLHDAAALGAAHARPRGDRARWAWWLHQGAAAPDPEAWAVLAPLADALDARVVAHPSLAPDGLRAPQVVAPGVDPLAPRHAELPPKVIGAFARTAGLDLGAPLVAAVADLDAWAEPEDAIDAWQAARGANEATRDLQLALVARVAHGDERAWRAIGELHEYAAGRAGLVVCADVAGHGESAANAVQRLARVALQDARDGYGIAAAEALWKSRPVVVADAPPLREQVTDGEHGHVAASAAQRGARIAELVADPGLAAQLGAAGRSAVRERHLVSTSLLAELELYARLAPA